MADAHAERVWGGTDAYEAYMGRWSRPLAQAFIAWFAIPAAGRWLDVGCGTGALGQAVLDAADPIAVVGVDPSPEFIATATAQIPDPRARFAVGDARALPVEPEHFDAVVAGLVLNHVPDASAAVAGMARAARPGGAVGAYVWDYAGGMRLIRAFWEAAAATDAAASALDPGVQFPLCRPEPLAASFRTANLGDVAVEAIDLPMGFRDFDDYWLPHLLRGPAAPQRYVASLGDGQRTALREQLRATLPAAVDGSIRLVSRAWAVRGTKGLG